MSRLRTFLCSLLLLLSSGLAFVPAANAYDILGPACKLKTVGTTTATVCSEKKPAQNPFLTVIGVAIRILSLVIGVASTIVIIVSSFRLINSGGDSSKVAQARSGIIYALIGIAIAVLSAMFVGFILDNLA